MAEQEAKRVVFQTRVIQAKKQVLVLNNQAGAEAEAIRLTNDAFCVQLNATQVEVAEG